MSPANPTNDPLAFGRQLWQQWNDAIQSAAPASTPQVPDWGAAMRNWGELAAGGSLDANRAADKLGVHGQQFFTLMQNLVQRASSGAASTPELGSLWRTQVGDGNPMLDALRQVSAEGARGWEQLMEATRAASAPVTTELLSTLQLPGVGLGRERQAQIGELIAAQAAQVEALQRYQQLLAKASESGMERFESKLAEHSEPGRQIGSMRALYDLWIDAAEEAYAETALSPAFREAYGNLVNTQMRSKQLQQREVSRHASELGLPTRSELDGVLRRIHQLQRELRELRSALAAKPAAADSREKPATSGVESSAAAPAKAASPSPKRAGGGPAASKATKAAPRKAAASAPPRASKPPARAAGKASVASAPVKPLSPGLFPPDAPSATASAGAGPARKKKSASTGKAPAPRRRAR